MIKIYALAGLLVLVLVVGAYLQGGRHKEIAMLLDLAQAEEARREAFAKLEKVRVALETQRMLTRQQQEDEARAEPVTVPDCLSIARVRRLAKIK
jgi:hypothetical protein